MLNNSAKERLKQIKCFALDMDGTFYLGNNIIDGSLEFLEKVKQTGRDFVFLTNNSSKDSQAYLQKLSRMGVNITEDRLITSGHVTISYLRQSFPGKKVFLLGNDTLTREFLAHGIALDDQEPDLCVIAYDTQLNYEKLCKACFFVEKGLPYIATHPDINCPSETGHVPDIGAVISFIKTSAGREPDRICGKPNKDIADYLTQKTGYEPSQIAMVGDRLYTDIATGVNFGLLAVLVLTGETSISDLETSTVTPDLVFESLKEMKDYLD